MTKIKTLNMAQKIFVVTVALITVSYANPSGEKGEPPKEAIEICIGQEVNSECIIDTPRGSLTGTCVNTPDDKYFVCMPEGGPKSGGRPDKR